MPNSAHRRFAFFVFLAVVLLTRSSTQAQEQPKQNGDKTKTVKVTIDVSGAPETKEWADKAKIVVEEWYPKVAEMLKSDGFTPPTDVKLVFKKMNGVAFASGKTITISASWIKKQPGDFGMVVHELTHVIQSYKGNKNAGWLVEGIADYVRFFHYEPKTKLTLNVQKASFRDGYRTSAQFLAWIKETQDKEIVSKLNIALRKGQYKDELFRDYTGKTLDELWVGFIMDRKK
jgi:hypothetical protein